MLSVTLGFLMILGAVTVLAAEVSPYSDLKTF